MLCGTDDVARLCADYNQLLCARPAPTRPLPSPDRVLDAPMLRDDFYSNPVDWGNRGHLAIGLGESVYLWRDSDDGDSGGSGEAVVELAGEGEVGSVSFIHDGTMVAVGRADGRLQVWDVTRQHLVRTMIPSGASDTTQINALSWNKHVITAGSKSGIVTTMDARLPHAHAKVWSIAGNEEVCGVKWSWEGDQLAIGANDNLVRIVDQQGAITDRLAHHRAAVKALSWCPYQSGLLATGGGTACQHLALVCTRSATTLLTTHPTGAQISGVVWDRASRHLATTHGFPTHSIQLWRHSRHHLDLVTMVEAAHEQRILHAALGPTGSVVTAGADECVKVWRLFDGFREVQGGAVERVLLPKLLSTIAKNKRNNSRGSTLLKKK